jgi:hypothetical protein
VPAFADPVVGDVEDGVAADFVPPAPQPTATMAKPARSVNTIIGLALPADSRETEFLIT